MLTKQKYKKQMARILTGLIAVAATFAVGAFTAQEAYADVPYFMLGHSMGSFLIRQYMMMHGEGLAGVIVMGTGAQPAGTLKMGKFICSFLAKIHDWHYRSKMVNNMAIGSYNKSFEPAVTPVDWLTKDMTVRAAYLADPKCTFVFTVNGYYQMFRSIEYVQDAANIARIPKDLPVLLTSGEDDPVGGKGEGVKAVYKALEEAAISDLSMKLYPGDRHEILNETDYQRVYLDLLAWFEEHMGPADGADTETCPPTGKEETIEAAEETVADDVRETADAKQAVMEEA